jgi:mRNA interferase MazF
MTVRRGDVVLLQAPFTTGGGMKIRPMLVVQNDLNNGRMANTILALITSNTSRSSEPTQVLVDVNSADGRLSGLKQNSVISCENILTVMQTDIIRAIGHLPVAVMQAVDQALKTSLGLS